MKASDEERRVWRKLDESIRRNDEAIDHLGKWIKGHDRTPPKPPVSQARNDGCIFTVMAVFLWLAVAAAQVLA